jgi:hypothetical protein
MGGELGTARPVPRLPPGRAASGVHNQHHGSAQPPIRKIIKTRGSFPDEDSARSSFAITRAQRKRRHTYSWSSALTAFGIHFGDRIPDTAVQLSYIDAPE